MNSARYQVIVLVPFFAAALFPWLSPEAAPRITLLTTFWGVCLAIFSSGFCAGDASSRLLQNPRLRLNVLASIANVVLALAAIALHFIWSPLAGIAIVAAALFFSHQLLCNTQYVVQLSDLDVKFFQKLVWVALGCLMMLALSYYRFSHPLTP